ncbi:MAG TPA: hypothetical protein PK544_17165, partial [Spirochaetota bacterium]|nr:hypothetical protein [Spirochaetota bacterium]
SNVVINTGDLMTGGLAISETGATASIHTVQNGILYPSAMFETQDITNPDPVVYINNQGTGHLIQASGQTGDAFVVDNYGNIYASGSLNLDTSNVVINTGDLMTGGLAISETGATASIHTVQNGILYPSAMFETQEVTNPDPVVYINNQGTGNLIQASGQAGDAFILDNTGNIYASGSLYLSTSNVVLDSGDTMSGPLTINYDSSTATLHIKDGVTAGNALFVEDSGKTIATATVLIQTDNTDTSSYGLKVAHTGGGRGIFSESSGTGISIYGYNTGGGTAVQAYGVGTSKGLYATHNGSGNAIHGYQTGTGKVALFHINSGTNSSDAIHSYTIGTGRASYFQIGNASNNSEAVYAESTGTGALIGGTQSGGGYVLDFATGGTSVFLVDNDANVYASGSVIASSFSGDGSSITNVNAATLDSLYSADFVNVAGSLMTGPLNIDYSTATESLYVSNTGTGGAASFEVNNTLSSTDAVKIVTNSSQTDGNGLFVQHNGTNGLGMKIQVTGTNGSGAGLYLTDATNPKAIITGNTEGTGALINLQQNTINKFTVDNAGVITLQGCPTGTVDAGNFCVEADERTSDTFFNASGICRTNGMQLCSPSQWTSACTQVAGLNSITGNGEWADSIFYSTAFYGLLMGSANCTSIGMLDPASTAPYRCCYSK